MPLTDYQGAIVERSFTFGRATLYPGVGGTKGAMGLPDVRPHDVEFELRDGAQAGVDVYGQRVIQVPLQCIADNEDALATQINTLQAAWAVSSEDLELQLKFAGTQLSYFGRPRGLSENIGRKGLISGHALFIGTFVASDPFAYSDEITDAADASSPVVVANAGNAISRRCFLSILGSGGIPSITNTSDPHGGDITFVNSVANGQTCVVDLATQTARIGATDVTQRIAISSLWTDLQVGNNSMTFTGCTSITALHRHAYQGN